MITSSPDPLKYRDLERYLFETVGPTFRETGELSPFMFFSIVVWKANRAKSKIAKRLKARVASRTLSDAVRELAQDLRTAQNAKGRMRLLLTKWGLKPPMASAILTVLWPDEFTIWDVRVQGELPDFESPPQNFDRFWSWYERFCDAVRAAVPGETLRNADRVLWARSAIKQLETDIARKFSDSHLEE
jgi:hypothetical protein